MMEMKIVEITDDHIKFDNGVKITFEHDQDCCEHVYCYFKTLNDTDIKDIEFNEILIEPVENSGFRLNNYFIPCYNSQNGYYSDDLELIIDYGNNKKLSYDLQKMNCVKDNID